MTHQTFRLPAAGSRPSLFVRRQPRIGAPPVLYVHGATFPSALSVGFDFGGGSWLDDWNARGFDAWAFDFAGFGESGRYPAMSEPAEHCAPLGRGPEAAGQIAAVLALIRRETGRPREAQHGRFIEDVPRGHAPVLVAFDRWAPAYLASDPDSASRTPPAVRIPNGPRADNADAWAGYLAWNPAELTRPLSIVRGTWDSLCTDSDVAGLLAMATSAPERLDTRLDAGTHLMHLETGRRVLYEAVGRALTGEKP